MSTNQRLLERREQILTELSEIYPLHRGSVYEHFTKCGKPTCQCASPGHRGHGPRHLLTWKNAAKTKALPLKTEESISLAEQHVSAFRRHQQLVDELVHIGETLSEQSILSGRQAEVKKKRLPSNSKKKEK